MKVMLWENFAEIEDQLLKVVKEENQIIALSNVRGNTYQDN